MSSPRPYRGLTVTKRKWVEGWYVYSEQLNAHYIVEAGFQSNHTCVNSPGIIYVQGSYEVIPETVGQYTGLKDKNEKEGYRDDIVFHRKGEPLYIISWDVCNAKYYLRCNDQRQPDLGISNLLVLEVIGDIHTKPELLEARNV